MSVFSNWLKVFLSLDLDSFLALDHTKEDNMSAPYGLFCLQVQNTRLCCSETINAITESQSAWHGLWPEAWDIS